MGASVLRARLDLLVRVHDTTTGADVEESNILFMKDDRPIIPGRKGNSTFVFINTGRENFLMRVRAYGYEEYTVFVDYSSLDQRMPICDVFLIPSENALRVPGLISFKGNLPFLKTIEAVNLSRPLCSFQAYDPKKNLMTTFGHPGSRTLPEVGIYAVVSRANGNYERIEVTKAVTGNSYNIREKPSSELVQGDSIMRIMYGSVTDQGDYLFRARDDSENLIFLMRYEVGDEVRFQTVDLKDQEALK